MEFKHLEAFVHVVDHRHFSAAAETLFLSQSSVSLYINHLEKALKVKLLNRTTKEVCVTPAGKILYAHAQKMLALRNTTLSDIKKLREDYSGQITVLASSLPAQYLLPALVAQFSARYPQITFHVRQENSQEVACSVAAYKAEIGFAGTLVKGAHCAFHPFFADEMCLIAPNQPAFSQAAPQPLATWLAQHPYVGRESGSGTRTQYEAIFTQHGIVPGTVRPRATFENAHSIVAAVTHGLGLSIVSKTTAARALASGNVVSLPLTHPLPCRTLYYVLKDNFAPSHLVALFVDFLREAATCAPCTSIAGDAGLPNGG